MTYYLTQNIANIFNCLLIVNLIAGAWVLFLGFFTIYNVLENGSREGLKVLKTFLVSLIFFLPMLTAIAVLPSKHYLYSKLSTAQKITYCTSGAPCTYGQLYTLGLKGMSKYVY